MDPTTTATATTQATAAIFLTYLGAAVCLLWGLTGCVAQLRRIDAEYQRWRLAHEAARGAREARRVAAERETAARWAERDAATPAEGAPYCEACGTEHAGFVCPPVGVRSLMAHRSVGGTRIPAVGMYVPPSVRTDAHARALGRLLAARRA